MKTYEFCGAYIPQNPQQFRELEAWVNALAAKGGKVAGTMPLDTETFAFIFTGTDGTACQTQPPSTRNPKWE